MSEPVLRVRHLSVDYVTPAGPVRAVDDISFDVSPGEMLGIVGESGSGKSTLGMAIPRVLPPPAAITSGSIHFDGRDLLALEERALRDLRWKGVAIVFQGAMDALNPVLTVGEQVADALRAHGVTGRREAWERAGDLLSRVGIGADHRSGYAHQFSGGMRQRVCIAMALAWNPRVLILDEPTTALDVIVEREILEQVRALQRELGFSVLLITHDLARMFQFSDRIAVLYAARLAEIGRSEELRRAPRHPYTQAFVRAFPTLDPEAPVPESIPGSPPSLLHPPTGCRFHPRCPWRQEICVRETPELRVVGGGGLAACHFAE